MQVLSTTRSERSDALVKVYIAGPIAGQPNGNREAFAQRAKELETAGHEPLNPWDIPPDHNHGSCMGGKVYETSVHEYGCFLRNDIMAMMWCDAVSMLPGWEQSKGATTEYAVAIAIGLQILDA